MKTDTLATLIVCGGALGVCCAIAGVGIGAYSCANNQANKEINNAKGKIDAYVAADVGAKSVDLSLMEVESAENSKYLLNLYGVATLEDGSTIDLMNARYSMSQKTYVSLMSVTDGSSAKSLDNLDNISYGRYNQNYTNKKFQEIVNFLNELYSAIESSEYVGSTLDGTIEADSQLICYVSQPKEVDGKSSVDVIYAQPTKADGKMGITSKLVTISLNSKNEVENLEEKSTIFTKLGKYDMLTFGEDFVKAHYQPKELQNEGRTL